MKIQDIVFFVVLALLILKRSPGLCAICGILCLLLSMPLFSFWIFFTAERLTWYAGAFFLLSIVFYLFNSKKHADKALKVLSGSKKFSFKPKGLILGYLGDHGAVGIVESFSFK